MRLQAPTVCPAQSKELLGEFIPGSGAIAGSGGLRKVKPQAQGHTSRKDRGGERDKFGDGQDPSPHPSGLLETSSTYSGRCFTPCLGLGVPLGQAGLAVGNGQWLKGQWGPCPGYSSPSRNMGSVGPKLLTSHENKDLKKRLVCYSHCVSTVSQVRVEM